MPRESYLHQIRTAQLGTTRKAIGGLVVLAVLLVLPFELSSFHQSVFTSILFGIIIAGSWNLLSGLTGYINLGHAAFIGVGAFAAGHLIMRVGIGESVGFGIAAVIIVAGLISAGYAAIIAYPLLRLNGFYFALATLATAEATAALFKNVDWLQGNRGLRMPPLTTDVAWLNPSRTLYFMMLAIAVVTLVSIYAIHHSKLGYGFRAIGLGQDAAETLGVPTNRYIIYAFALSGFFAGMGGAAYGYFLAYFSSSSVFSLELTLNAVVMTFLGGIGTIAGPVVGAAVLTVLDQLVLTPYTTQGKRALTGIILILIFLKAPKGILGYVRQGVQRLKSDAAEEDSQ